MAWELTPYGLPYLIHYNLLGSCADPEGGGGGATGRLDPTPWKITKIWGSLVILVRIPLKSQSYQARIQCLAIIGPLAKRHIKSVLLAGRWCPAFSAIWILPPLIKQKKNKKKKPCQIWTPSMGCRFSIYSLFMDIHNSFMDIHK